MISALRSFWSLDRRERALLISAGLLQVIFGLALRLVQFERVRRFSLWAGRFMRRSYRVRLDADSVSTPVRRAGRYCLFGTCLTRALTAHVLLSRTGHSPTLRVGIRRISPGRWAAHAWVECGGMIVVGGSREQLGSYILLSIDELSTQRGGDWSQIA
jgi:hypothetical protein